MSQLKINLSTLTGGAGIASLEEGVHTLKLKAKGQGKAPSLPSESVNFTVYSITPHLTNVTAQPNPTKIAQGSTATLVFTANEGYKMPSTVTVTGATPSWTVSTTSTTDDTGTLVLTNPTGNVEVTVVGEQVQTGETWVINQTPTVTANATYNIGVTYNYFGQTGLTANSFSLTVVSSPMGNDAYIKCGLDAIYNLGWQGQYPTVATVTFATAPTGDLLTWLQENATKQ